MSQLWFRMYAEAVDDEKLRLLAFEDRWHFVAILCLKALGTLDSDAPHLERRIALKLGLQIPQLDELKRRLMEIALIDEHFQPLKWSKRQFKSDHDAAERKRAQRERDSHNNVTTTNCESHATEQNRTDTEQNRTEMREDTPISGLDQSAWDRWFDYRREIRKPIKPASIQAAQIKLAGFGTDQSAVVEQSIANSWQGLFPMKTEAKESVVNRRRHPG